MKNIPIIGKFLSILALFGIFAIGATVYSTSQMRCIQSGYQAIANASSKATTQLILANRYLVAMKADVTQELIERDAASHAADAAALVADRANYDAAMAQAEAASPSQAAVLSALAGQVHMMMDDGCAMSMKMGIAAVTQAEDAASQAVYLTSCSPKFAPILAHAVALRKIFQADTQQANIAIAAQANNTIMLTYAMVLGGLALVVIAGFFAIRAWVVSPVKGLQAIMGQLASGNYQTMVNGAERMDEIGGMFRAVQVFKDAGLEKLRLEAEAKALAEAAAAERARARARRGGGGAAGRGG